MAVAYESIATTTFAIVTNLVITKPTGLAVGDIMVAYVTGEAQFNVPSGWTSQGFQFSDGALSDTFTKVADSADVAASNFTFTTGGSGVKGGFLIRVSGGAHSRIQKADTARSNSSTNPVVLTGLTPNHTDSLFMILVVKNESGTPAFSGYAITTNDPTWTERADFNNGGTLGMAGATAIRASAAATGNGSVSITNLGSTSDVVARILVIPPIVSYTLTAEVGAFILTGINVALPVGKTLIAGVGEFLLAGIDATFAVTRRAWVGRAKDTTDDWINRPKS